MNFINQIVMKLVKDILFVISIIAVIAIATVMGFNNMRIEMGIIIGLGIAIWFFLTIEKFEYFKGAGIEAKLNKAVNDANATIEELRELAASLAEPTITLITMENRMFQYIPLSSKIQMKEDIMNSLRKLVVEDSRIKKVASFMDNVITQDHLYRIKDYFEAKKIDDSILRVLEECVGADFLSQGERALMNLTDFIVSENLMDSTVSKYIEDLKYFVENRKLKCPGDWC